MQDCLPIEPAAPKTRRSRQSRTVWGSRVVTVGGDAPVRVQSMTNTDTADIDATVKQVLALAQQGSELVRITVDRDEAAAAVPHIRDRLLQMGVEVPLVGDFHYIGHKLLADHPACAEALDKYRINPGNVGFKEKKDRQFAAIVETAIRYGKTVRIGANWGSLDQELLTRLMDENSKSPQPKDARQVMHEAIVQSGVLSARRAEELGLGADRIVISAKVSAVQDLVSVYTMLAQRCTYALHLGLTEAGMGSKGIVASSAAMGIVLQAGIGDTIRYSLTADPVEEARAGRQLLEAMGLRERKGLDLIACPSCGRAEVDVIAVANAAQEALEGLGLPIQVAVMGCVVNGPGEARDADLGIAAGRRRGHLFVKGKVVKVVAEPDMVDALVEWAHVIAEEGVEGALTHADAGAAAEAEADRAALLEEQGADANASEQRVDVIRKLS